MKRYGLDEYEKHAPEMVEHSDGEWVKWEDVAEKVFNKKEFMQQYVLNRALAASDGLDGYAVANEAFSAYLTIEGKCKE